MIAAETGARVMASMIFSEAAMDELGTTNRLLNLLGDEDADRFRPFLQRVELPVRTVLQEVGSAIRHIHFLERGLASVIAASGSEEVEIALLGKEAMSGLPVLSGLTTSSHKILVQVAGSALRIDRETFLDLVEQCPSAREVFLKFRECFAIQVEQAALANGRYNIEPRLTRWLLMCHDRLGEVEIRVTHETLALMLGVRRAGVTTALHILEGNRLIKATRGTVLIRDRAALEAIAGESYGAPEAAYKAILDGRAGPAKDGSSSAIHSELARHSTAVH
jgi:CRP-like cAMP-binding protein